VRRTLENCKRDAKVASKIVVKLSEEKEGNAKDL
jgi:hypothetical protein